VTLSEMSDLGARTNQVVGVQNRTIGDTIRPHHSYRSAAGSLHLDDLDVPRHPLLRSKPRLHDEDTTLVEMGCHAQDGAVQALNRAHIADRRKQAGNGVEGPVKVERRHVGTDQFGTRATPLSDAQETGFNVETDTMHLLAEELEMSTGPTCHVE
jgi:hypothetical protein